MTLPQTSMTADEVDDLLTRAMHLIGEHALTLDLLPSLDPKGVDGGRCRTVQAELRSLRGELAAAAKVVE